MSDSPPEDHTEPSICSSCPLLKLEYERCFQHWYQEKFLKSGGTVVKLDCQDLFEKYQACVKRNLEERGLSEVTDNPEALFNKSS